MGQTICRPEDYKRDLHAYFNKFIEDPLMNINPYDIPDSELLAKINDYSTAVSNKQFPFCTWITIEGIGESNYNGKDFKFVKLGFEGKNIFTINFSQFRYPMSPSRSLLTFDKYNSNEANYVCMIDYKEIDPESFFYSRIGKRLFYVYSFPAVNSFGSSKLCYFLAEKLVSPYDIRRHIISTQYNLLHAILNDPLVNAPGTTVEFTSPSGASVLQHYVITDITQKFASEIFDKDFREKMETKLNYISQQNHK